MLREVMLDDEMSELVLRVVDGDVRYGVLRPVVPSDGTRAWTLASNRSRLGLRNPESSGVKIRRV